MVKIIFFCVFFLELASSAFCEQENKVLLRYKPRLRESIYTYYSKGDTMFKNGAFQKMVTSNSQLYVGLRTVKTLENGHLIQRAGVSAGNISINGQVYAHPALGNFVEYVLAPWGGIPKAIGNGNQFKIKEMQLVLPKEPVSIGSTWEVTLPKSISFPLETTLHYKVTNMLGNLVIIHSSVDVTDEEVIPNLFFTMKGTSQLIFNSEEGLLLRNESNQYLEVTRKGRRGSGERSTKMNVNSILELQF
jgi:hypothetical protein